GGRGVFTHAWPPHRGVVGSFLDALFGRRCSLGNRRGAFFPKNSAAYRGVGEARRSGGFAQRCRTASAFLALPAATAWGARDRITRWMRAISASDTGWAGGDSFCFAGMMTFSAFTATPRLPRKPATKAASLSAAMSVW